MEIDWRDAKTTIPATLYTEAARIEGDVYAIHGSRLLDILNSRERPFFGIANATLTFLQTGEVVLRPFLILSKQAIVWAWPHEDEPQRPAESAEQAPAE
jgi:hypothetical protein